MLALYSTATLKTLVATQRIPRIASCLQSTLGRYCTSYCTCEVMASLNIGISKFYNFSHEFIREIGVRIIQWVFIHFQGHINPTIDKVLKLQYFRWRAIARSFPLVMVTTSHYVCFLDSVGFLSWNWKRAVTTGQGSRHVWGDATVMMCSIKIDKCSNQICVVRSSWYR